LQRLGILRGVPGQHFDAYGFGYGVGHWREVR
jgi:hypothetical protein